jgi:hypothetical protein
MNIKFSQLEKKSNALKSDIFPILRDKVNYTTTVDSVYSLLSGDKVAEVYTSYSKNSSIFINDHSLVNSVYTTYNQKSANYVSINTPITNKWESVSTQVIASSANWNNTYTTWSQTSGIVVTSDTTAIPQATAIKNIIALPLSVYESLTVLDPYTFYVVV